MRSIILNKIFFAAIALILFASPKNVTAQLIDKIIVKVDNQIILQSELEQAYVQFLAQQQGATGENLKCKVLETLIINKLMLAKAEIDSVTVDRESVDGELDRRMDHFVMQAGGDASKLEEYYGKTLEELKTDMRKMVREQMVIQKMQDNITNKVKVTPGEVKNFFNEIPKDSLPFFSTEVEIGQIIKIPKVSKTGKAVLKEKAEKIRERILAGEDFCEIAKQYSDDVGSAKQCGEIGWFQRGDLVGPYEASALGLKVGETSPVTESEYGYHIIQLLERRGNEFNSRHVLLKLTTSEDDLETAAKFLDSLKNKILKDSITFENAANKFSDDKLTSANGGIFIDEHSGSTRIPLENLDPSIFFVIDTMNVGSISSPIRFKLEGDEIQAVKIIYYKSKTPPHQASLKIDYQKIYKATLTEKKNNAINEWFDKTKHEIFIDINPEFKNCDILTTQ